MKAISVLGLGESVNRFVRDRNEISIGVNDIQRYTITDFVLVLDHPSKFSADRLQHIEQAKGIVMSQILDWQDKCKSFMPIEIYKRNISPDCLDKGLIPFSNNSPYVACCVAYLMGATQLDIYGVDLIGHKHLGSDVSLNIALADFNKLFKYLHQRNVKINLHCKLKELI